MKNYIIIYLAMSFFAGVGSYALVTFQVNTNDFSSNVISSRVSGYSNYKILEKQLIIVNNKVDENNVKLDRMLEMVYEASSIEKQDQSEHEKEDGVNVTHLQNKISPNEVNSLKSIIFNSLSNSDTTLPQILNSPELNKLPEQAKHETITEIVRQINDREISIKLH